jgi:hypothetical protein
MREFFRDRGNLRSEPMLLRAGPEIRLGSETHGQGATDFEKMVSDASDFGSPASLFEETPKTAERVDSPVRVAVLYGSGPKFFGRL